MPNNSLIKQSVDLGNSWTSVLAMEDESYYPVLTEAMFPIIFCFYILKSGSDYHIRLIKSFDSGTNFSSPVTKISDVVFGSLGLEESLTGTILLTYWKDDAGTDKQFLQKFGIDGNIIGSAVAI